MVSMINAFRRLPFVSHFQPFLMGRVRLGAVLTPEDAFLYKTAIDDGLNKTEEINLFVQMQGPNLVTKLGAQVVAWNQSWSSAQALAPTIANYKMMFDGEGPYLWDAAKDANFAQWQAAVTNLYNIYKAVTEPGGVPTPTPPSETSDTVLYVVGGVGALALVGSLIYAFTR